MLRKIKSFFIGAFRKVKNGLNKFLGKKTMANYLLECEIVGGEIVSPAGSNLVCSVCVSPMNRIRKSDLISGSQVFGVAVEEKSPNSFAVDTNSTLSRSISLDEQGQTPLEVSNASMATALLSCNGMRVVLELAPKLNSDDLTIVGFKAQF